jgi:hypothetical protein
MQAQKTAKGTKVEKSLPVGVSRTEIHTENATDVPPVFRAIFRRTVRLGSYWLGRLNKGLAVKL